MGSETRQYCAPDAHDWTASTEKHPTLNMPRPICAKCGMKMYIEATATPPTPDRAAVREGLINAIEALRVTVHRAPSEEFAMLWRNVHRAIDALLRPASLPADVQAVVELLRELVAGEDACRYDHHGYCQSHRLNPKPCPVERATALLAHLTRTEG